MKNTNKIIAALEHVRQTFPQIERVYFDELQRWYYTDNFRKRVVFGDSIDIDILEAALDQVWDHHTVPVAFQYEKEIRQVIKLSEAVSNIDELIAN